jgi:hypothetical protein
MPTGLGLMLCRTAGFLRYDRELCHLDLITCERSLRAYIADVYVWCMGRCCSLAPNISLSRVLETLPVVIL